MSRQHNVRIVITAVLLSAGATAQSLPVAQARLLLLAAAKADLAPSWNVGWRDRCEAAAAGGSNVHEVGRWEVQGNPITGAARWAKLALQDGSTPLQVTTWRDGVQIFNTRREGYCDALIRPHEEFVEMSTSPVMAYLRPFGRSPWIDQVQSTPIVSAERTPTGLIVLFGLHEEVVKAAMAGRAVTGLLGWRCHFERIDGGLRLTTVEFLETPVVCKAPQEGGENMPNDLLLPDFPVVPILGGIQGGVARVVEFGDFRTFGPVVMPTAASFRTRLGMLRSKVDVASIAPLPAGTTLAIEPARELGAVAKILDGRTGRTSYATDGTTSGDELIERLAACAPKLGAGRDTHAIPMAAWALGVVALCAGAFAVPRVVARRRRQAAGAAA